MVFVALKNWCLVHVVFELVFDKHLQKDRTITS